MPAGQQLRGQSLRPQDAAIDEGARHQHREPPGGEQPEEVQQAATAAAGTTGCVQGNRSLTREPLADVLPKYACKLEQVWPHVRQNDDCVALFRAEKRIACVSCGAAVVLEDFVVGVVNPGEGNARARCDLSTQLVLFLDRRPKLTGAFGMQICRQIAEHIRGGRAKGSRAGKRAQIHNADWNMGRSIALNQTFLLFGRELHNRIMHAKRLGDAAHQIGIVCAGTDRERFAPATQIPGCCRRKTRRGDSQRARLHHFMNA